MLLVHSFQIHKTPKITYSTKTKRPYAKDSNSPFAVGIITCVFTHICRQHVFPFHSD